MKKNKKLTLKEFVEKMKRLVYKKRSPIKPTKIIRDKTKYNRKKKHKKNDE